MEIWFQKMAHCNRNMVVDINDNMVSEVMAPCRSYNMVVVTAFCRRDMAPDLSYNMVVVVAPCRRDMVPDLSYNMVVLALSCKDMEEELYCNKMVALALPPLQRCGRRSPTATRW